MDRNALIPKALVLRGMEVVGVCENSVDAPSYVVFGFGREEGVCAAFVGRGMGEEAEPGGGKASDHVEAFVFFYGCVVDALGLVVFGCGDVWAVVDGLRVSG